MYLRPFVPFTKFTKFSTVLGTISFLVVASDIEEDDGSWLLLYPSVRTERFRTLVVPQGAGLLLNLLELLGTIIPVP